MKAFHIHDVPALLQKEVGKVERLVKIASGIVPEVKYQIGHTLVKQVLAGCNELLGGCPGEFLQFDVTGSIVDHERGVHAVYRYLSAGYLKRDHLSVTHYGNGNLCSGLALHPGNHAVLRKVDSCNHFLVHFQEPVTLLETCLVRRAAGYYLHYNGGIVGNVELYANAVETSCQFGLALLERNRRKIHGMWVKGGKRRRGGGLSH